MPLAYSAVVPAHNAGGTLDQCLAGLKAAVPAPNSIVVFDDGSTDETSEIARRHGVIRLRNDGPAVGPAIGRNRGAAACQDPVILFVDADVVANPDAPRRLIEALGDNDTVAAAFGSYGTFQATKNLAARYANLRHHYFHQISGSDAETFWTGLGAVRRRVFQAVGGFDEVIARPGMEDVELGGRLRSHGYRIRCVPDALGTHLKNWKLFQLWRDDVVSRAIPWTRYLLSGKCKASLNASRTQKLIAILAHLIWISAALSVFDARVLFVTLGLLATYGWANRRLLSIIARHGGWLAALSGLGLHWAYHLYSSAIFGSILVLTKLKLVPLPSRSGGIFADR